MARCPKGNIAAQLSSVRTQKTLFVIQGHCSSINLQAVSCRITLCLAKEEVGLVVVVQLLVELEGAQVCRKQEEVRVCRDEDQVTGN